MADYYSQTVIQQEIPIIDMTALERLVLAEMFHADDLGDTLYFSADEGAPDMIWLARTDLDEAMKANPKEDTKWQSPLIAIAASAIDQMADVKADVEIDLSGISWETIFQPIIKRSKTLNYITIVTSWTCSKMRVDGFGGMVLMVTANTIKSHSTNDSLEKWVGQIERAEERKAAKRAQTSKSLP